MEERKYHLSFIQEISATLKDIINREPNHLVGNFKNIFGNIKKVSAPVKRVLPSIFCDRIRIDLEKGLIIDGTFIVTFKDGIGNILNVLPLTDDPKIFDILVLKGSHSRPEIF